MLRVEHFHPDGRRVQYAAPVRPKNIGVIATFDETIPWIHHGNVDDDYLMWRTNLYYVDMGYSFPIVQYGAVTNVEPESSTDCVAFEFDTRLIRRERGLLFCGEDDDGWMVLTHRVDVEIPTSWYTYKNRKHYVFVYIRFWPKDDDDFGPDVMIEHDGMFTMTILRRRAIAHTGWMKVRKVLRARSIVLFWNDMTAHLMDVGGVAYRRDHESFARDFVVSSDV